MGHHYALLRCLLENERGLQDDLDLLKYLGER